MAGNPIVSGKASPEYHAAYEADYFKSEEKRKLRAERERRRVRTPDGRRKAEARWATRKAIRAGAIERAPCEVCGEATAEAHHDDYSKPLSIRWLCRLHHREHHAKYGNPT
jgi:hypothetical protein